MQRLEHAALSDFVVRGNLRNFLGGNSVDTVPIKSRVISVGIALGYGLDDRGSRVRFPAGAGNFLFTTVSRPALVPTEPPIQWLKGALSLGVKRPGREADHSSPSSAEVKE
jgi:hypothetical protein